MRFRKNERRVCESERRNIISRLCHQSALVQYTTVIIYVHECVLAESEFAYVRDKANEAPIHNKQQSLHTF